MSDTQGMEGFSRKKKIPGGVMFLLSLCLIVLFIAGALFIYKKVFFDYTGKYGSASIEYSKDYGIVKLYSLNKQYRNGDAEGFALINLPLRSVFFEERLRTDKDGNDLCDKEDFIYLYKTKSVAENLKNGSYNDVLGDDLAFISSVVMAFVPHEVTATCEIKGKTYYIIDYSDL